MNKDTFYELLNNKAQERGVSNYPQTFADKIFDMSIQDGQSSENIDFDRILETYQVLELTAESILKSGSFLDMLVLVRALEIKAGDVRSLDATYDFTQMTDYDSYKDDLTEYLTDYGTHDPSDHRQVLLSNRLLRHIGLSLVGLYREDPDNEFWSQLDYSAVNSYDMREAIFHHYDILAISGDLVLVY